MSDLADKETIRSIELRAQLPSSDGWTYDMLGMLDLTQPASIDGRIEWTVLAAPANHPNVKRLKGKKATEYVKGLLKGNELKFSGYEKDDKGWILGTSESGGKDGGLCDYTLQIHQDGTFQGTLTDKVANATGPAEGSVIIHRWSPGTKAAPATPAGEGPHTAMWKTITALGMALATGIAAIVLIYFRKWLGLPE